MPVAFFPVLKLRKTEKCCATPRPSARPRTLRPPCACGPTRLSWQAQLGGQPTQPAGAPRRVWYLLEDLLWHGE